MTKTLEQFIYGRPVVDDQLADAPTILALSDGLTLEQALAMRAQTVLEPFAMSSGISEQTVGVFAGLNGDYLLVRAQYQQDDAEQPMYQYVALPGTDYRQLAGDLSLLMELIKTPIPIFTDANTVVPALNFSESEAWSMEQQITLFESLVAQYGGFHRLLKLLAAALHERQLLICGFPEVTAQRVELVQALMLLLPEAVRAELTFATYAPDVEDAAARIIFSNESPLTARWVADFATEMFPGDKVLEEPYPALLASLWGDDPSAFLARLNEIELVAPLEDEPEGLSGRLTRTVERYYLNQRILGGEEVSLEELKTILTGELSLSGAAEKRCTETLLTYALAERDSESARIVTHYMDTHPDVDAVLNEILNAQLEEQPDAVYFCVRTRLSEGIDERWLPRLQAAAARSLAVAVNDGDNTTLASWLQLLSREPVKYELDELLHDGIFAALERAYDDGELGSLLIMLAVRRGNSTLETLLEDERFLAALAEPFGSALHDFNPDAVLALREQGRRIFLVALARAAEKQVGTVFTPVVIQQFWELYTTDPPIPPLSDAYQAENQIRYWIEAGVNWMPHDALETLLTLMLTSERDDLFYQLAHQLSEQELLFPPLASILQNSGRGVNAFLGLIGQLVTAGDITQQQAVNTYIALLVAEDWNPGVLPLVEQMVRMIQQSPSLSITAEVGWRLLEVAAETETELIARVATRRLLIFLETLDDEVELSDQLLHLYNSVQWCDSLHEKVMEWWREFSRQQSLVELHQLDKALEGKRQLEDARAIVRTVIAMRKLFGQQNFEDFAAAINTAYIVVQAFFDSFDLATKHPLVLDQPEVRAILDTQEGELNVQERKLLAKNLKELAQLITLLADHRSKPPLMRREDEFERQLLTGEHPPQSAVDTMKWLSGYLDGFQGNQEEKE